MTNLTPTTIAMQAREALAHKVASAFAKLADYKDDIEQLWIEFEKLEEGGVIMGCTTKTEFCEKVLGRSIRTVQYMLNGRTVFTAHEQCSSTEEPTVDDPARETRDESSQDTQDFAEALALPDAHIVAPKKEYKKNERGIKLLQKLASSVEGLYQGECTVKGTSGADNLPVTTGRYNIALNLKGVSMQRATNALKAFLQESETETGE